MRELAIEVHGLTMDFSALRALNDVSFSVPTGQVFGYLGPNGSGKTTTVRILTTLISPTKGEARVFGLDVRKQAAKVREKIGVVQQEISYEPYLSVWENLWLYGYLQGLSRTDARMASRELLDMFGLWEFRSAKAVSLSRGQRRRMQIARELLSNPALLFLDEPTVGLDVEARLMTLNIFKRMASNGTTIFFTTHNLSEVDELCDTVAFLNKGRLLAIESIEGFRARATGRRLEDAYLEVVSGDHHGKQAT